MKKYMELPADYAVLSDDEMTYTTGGSAVGGIVTIVGVAVLASSYVWGISQARDWLSVDSNRMGQPSHRYGPCNGRHRRRYVQIAFQLPA